MIWVARQAAAEWQARAALLTPIAKAYGTDIGCEVAHLGVQVHGGMGFIEETGAAQFSRDVRVTAIYEGTNGIQAMDLVGRKMMDNGEAAYRLFDEVQAAAEVARPTHPDLAGAVWTAAEALREATEALNRDADRMIALRVPCPICAPLPGCWASHFHLKAALADPARLPFAQFAIKRLAAGICAVVGAGARRCRRALRADARGACA